jgi:RNA polymerase sigma-70 factor, ECF subfamily
MSDDELMTRLGEKEPAALAEVYLRYRPAMCKFAGRIVGPSQAEDIVQDVLERLWTSPDAYESTRGSPRAYLITMARTRAIDVWRSSTARGRREDYLADGTQIGPDVESEALGRRVLQEIAAALSCLSVAEREAIVLAYFGDYTYIQVAKALERPEGTVKSHIRHGLHHLRRTSAPTGSTED